MDDQIKALLDAARSGEETQFEALVAALRESTSCDISATLEFLSSDESLLRRAAVEIARSSTDSRILAAFAGLVTDRNEEVRRALAETLKDNSQFSNERVIEQLLEDEDGPVRCAAVQAAGPRSGFTKKLVRLLEDDQDWNVRIRVVEVLKDRPAQDVLPALLGALGRDSDCDVWKACADTSEHHFEQVRECPTSWPLPAVSALHAAVKRVDELPHSRVPRLRAWLTDFCEKHIDIDSLDGFGTLLTKPAHLASLPRSYFADDSVEAVRQAIERKQAVVLLGESGVGKTAVVQELVHRLAHEDPPWHVLRMVPAEFLTGTKFLGEWQTRLHDLLEAIRAPRQIILYIPTLDDLAWVGRSSESTDNVASSLAPYIERGEIRIIGESTTDAFQAGLGANVSLGRLFHVVKLPPADESTTRSIVHAVAQESPRKIAEELVDQLIYLADYYSASVEQPGRTVQLLRRVVTDGQGQSHEVTQRDILRALSESTGIPKLLLDAELPLQPSQTREFFEQRVMGQPEAVDAAVDLVTLVKARLTDPGKPFGVLLFVGPTGVGKTELARAMAEFCFGDASRLSRIDMSEFASYEAYERLIGKRHEPGILTSVVREQPFSIVLLDEIEKAHLNVFDLCLQIFDAGRLTDGQGRSADFCRSIIILTSNVGSAVPEGPLIGFGERQTVAESSAASAHRELSRAFRPEFLNRIDRIIHFQPLSEETAERIARRELLRVLERSGIKQRKLMVDVDPAIIPVLLREGYSRAFGARPLKRTVERMVLLPLARAISAGEVPNGSVVRLGLRNQQIQAEVLDADLPESGKEAPLPAKLVTLRSQTDELTHRVAELREQAAVLSRRKSALLARMTDPGFWDRANEARQVSDQIYRCEAVLSQLEGLSKAVRGFTEFLQGQEAKQNSPSRLQARLEGLEVEISQVQYLVSCGDPRELGDAILMLTQVASQGEPLGAVERFARMYLNLAQRHKYETQVLHDRPGAEGEDGIAMRIDGVGAYVLLANESGLHQISRESRQSGEATRKDKEVVRVDCTLSDPLHAGFPKREIQLQVRPLNKPARRLLRPKHEVRLLHQPSLVSMTAWTDVPNDEINERLSPLLAARLELSQDSGQQSKVEPRIIRKYRLGRFQLVRDARTGRRSGRVDAILAGELDSFLIPLGSESAGTGLDPECE